MKKTVNRILAGAIAFAMIMTCNVFSVAAYAEETEIETLAEETTLSEEANSAGETEESPATDETMPVEDVNTLESSLADAESEILQESDEEDLLEETKEPTEETLDPEMLTFTAGNYSFGTDPVEWAQSGFNESAPKKYGCRIIAYSKMLVQTGAVPMSAVQNGSFNPGVLFDWFDRNGLVDSNLSEQGTPGVGAQTFAANFYGTTVTIEKKSFSGTDAQRKQLIVDGVKDGYVIILGQIGSGQHFVCVDSAKTLAEQYPYLQESYSKDPGRIVRCENGNRTLSSYTSIRYCKCTDAPAPGPTPTPGPTPNPTPTPIPTEYTGKCGENLTWKLKEDGTKKGYYNLTISGTGPMYDYPDPNYEDERTLTPWFACMRKIKENGGQYFNDVILENGITKVGSYAFYNFSFLGNGHTISIPDTVTEIGSHAYASSSFSGPLEIPDSVKTIGVSAFSGTHITSLTIGNGITEIPESCFYACDMLAGKIIIPDGVTRIGREAFEIIGPAENQSSVREISLPDSLLEIGEFAFSNNTKLQADGPILPQNLEKLGMCAFEGCSSLTGSLTIPATLTEVPWEAFRGCSGLTGLTIPEGVREIGVAAFYGCSNIGGTLTLPNGLEGVSEAAFKNCTSLTGLKLPEKLTGDRSFELENAAFEGCSSLTGNLVLDCDIVRFYNGDSSNRVFLGTNFDRILLQGRWRDYEVKAIKEKGATGTYYSYADQDENGNSIMTDVEVSTFPQDVIICYDDKFYQRVNGEPNYYENQLTEALTKLKYDWSPYSDAGISSPQYYIRKALGYDVTVTMGETGYLYLYEPDYADDADKVQISIADGSIAAVERVNFSDVSGSYWKVTPKKVGRTGYTVTISTKDYGLQTASGMITVVADNKSVRGVYLNYSSNTLEKGNSFTLKATVNPSSAKDKTVTWTSSDPSVATVTNKGVVKGVGKGEAVITATTKDGDFTASCAVSVTTKSYQIIFDANGAEGSMDPMECDYTEQYTLPANGFQREGYDFGGWGTDASCATLIKSVPKYRTSNIIVYAKWIPWNYTVTYDANKQPGMSVSGRMAKTSAKYGTDLKLRPNTFVNKGYRFEGWSLDENGTEALEALPIDEDYAPWDGIEAVEGLCPDCPGASVKLYALWKASDYLISYELNGGKKDEGTSDQYVEAYTYGIADPIILPTPVREGYKFEGWFTDDTFKKPIKQIDKKTFGDLTLYAKWSAPYKILLKDSDSGEEKACTGYTFNKEKALPANPFKSSDKAFMGWALTDDGEVLYTDKAKIKTPDLERVGNEFLPLTLYAVWKDSMSLDIRLDGGSYPTKENNPIAESSYTYSYDDIAKKAITLPKTLIKDGYKFAGWYDLLTGKKITKIDKKSFRDYKLEAAWVPLAYQIAYNANMPKGAKGSGKMTVQKLTFSQTAKLKPNEYYVKGYRFIGWSEDKNAYSAQFKDCAAFDFGAAGYKSKVTLYAVWERED